MIGAPAKKRADTGCEGLPRLLGPEATFPELRKTTYFRNAHHLAAELLGVKAESVIDGELMILKSDRCDGETTWHQDEAYWNPDLYLNHAERVSMLRNAVHLWQGCGYHTLPTLHQVVVLC